MAKWVDDKLIALAKKLIQIAAFIGISCKKLLVHWVLAASIFCMYPSRGTSEISDIIISATIAILFGLFWAMILLPKIIACYREDDTMANDLLLRNRRVRLFFFSMWPLLAYMGVYLPFTHEPIRLWILIPKLINVYFWPYIILNQNHRCKITAKELLRTIKKAMTPKPVSQPLPQPVPISFQTRV